MTVIADTLTLRKPPLWDRLKARGKPPIVIVDPLMPRAPIKWPDGGLFGLGAEGDEPDPSWRPSPMVRTLYTLLSLTGAATGAYHGYKRNDSLGWAIGWGLLGGAFPVITLPVSVAQGFGKAKK